MHIRSAEMKDIPQIVSLGRQLFELHVQYDNDYYELEDDFDKLFADWTKNYINHHSQFIIVAETENNEVIGFIAGFIKSLYPWFHIKSVGHISFMAIDNKFRKIGIGRLLEKQAKLWFKSKSISYVELYVEESNNIGQKAWSSYDFLPFKKFLRKKI